MENLQDFYVSGHSVFNFILIWNKIELSRQQEDISWSFFCQNEENP